MTNKKESLLGKIREHVFSYCIIVIIGSFLFFQSYRILVFNTIPHDPYDLIVKYWLGEEELSQMWSPHFYRFLYPWLTSIFSNLLPPIHLSQIPSNLSILDVQILEALAFVSSLFSTLFLFSVYQTIYTKYVSKLLALNTAFLCFLGLNFTAYFGADPLTLCWIFWTISLRGNKFYFTSLLFLSILINEKILIIFWLYFGSSVYFSKGKDSFQFVITTLACLLYYAIIKAFPLQGYKEVFEFSHYPVSLFNGLKYLFTFKGLYLNLIPCLSVLYIYFNSQSRSYFSENKHSVFFVTIVLMGLGLCFAGNPFIPGQYVIGRFIMHALPFYIFAISEVIVSIDKV